MGSPGNLCHSSKSELSSHVLCPQMPSLNNTSKRLEKTSVIEQVAEHRGAICLLYNFPSCQFFGALKEWETA